MLPVRRRTYVLDTSVLLSDPGAIARFDEHDVVIPLVVVIELEAKRSHPELGYFARNAAGILDLLARALDLERGTCRDDGPSVRPVDGPSFGGDCASQVGNGFEHGRGRGARSFPPVIARDGLTLHREQG